MLYKNQKEKVTKEEFANPSAEYRGTPFWAWNCRLEKAELIRQIEVFKEMGLGGFHMHSRTGLLTPYMNKEFMSMVKACNEKAKEENMLCWLYDEDRWPSGSCGGQVTKDISLAQRHLLFVKETRNGFAKDKDEYYKDPDKYKGYYLNSYEVKLDEEGFLADYSAAPNGSYNLYVEIDSPSSWFNNSYYIDVLNPKAAKKFVELTHEVYKNHVGDDFGKSIPAIFTDEPQTSRYKGMNFPDENCEIKIAYTDNFDVYFKSLYEYSLLDKFPEIIWQLPGNKPSVERYRFFEALSELFTRGFTDVIGKWCEKNNLMLTGHLMEEPTLKSQTESLGEAMRSYRSMQLPGIDMLCDHREFSTAKQAQSAAHQYGRDTVLSELYGVTGYQFDFKGHKLQGDWLAALGVGVRAHHLAWVSMEGEAKRDYPASIGCQAPWYKQYKTIEDHFSRVNLALSKGKPKVRVGVIHPVESYWMCMGPNSQTDGKRAQLEKNFSEIINYLLFNNIDFDFISESLLPGQYSDNGNGKFTVGEMAYNAIIIPNCISIRKTTMERLTGFAKRGGRVINVGNFPEYKDGVSFDFSEQVRNIFTCIPFEENPIVEALDEFRDLWIYDGEGKNSDNLLYNMRECDDCIWLFVAHAFSASHFYKNSRKVESEIIEKYTMEISGAYNVLLYDTLEASIYSYPSTILNGKTKLEFTMYYRDSLLLKLENKSNSGSIYPEYKAGNTFMETVGISHELVCEAEPEEENVLLLDMARYSIDGNTLQPAEEILRIDTKLRMDLGYPLRVMRMAQPWTMADVKNEKTHKLFLEYSVNCELDVKDAFLAIEDIDNIVIYLNGEKLGKAKSGYYVDKAIIKTPLPELKKGENILKITREFSSRTNLEACYILGNFGVRAEGCLTAIISSRNTVRFGDLTHQGYPFYGGNIKYRFAVSTQKGTGVIQTAQFSGMAVQVFVDGKNKGLIFKAPYISQKIEFEAGEHLIELVLLGNRYNTYAGLHNTNENLDWFGSNWWRTDGDSWSYEYNLLRFGITAAPKILYV